jgi:pimeloyl-ACP methyl ester carboxylesterase
MPESVQIDGLRLCYEEQGEQHGETLVLVPGMGYGRWLWSKQLPAFSKRFRTITLDNRGSGQSDKPPGPYTIAQMAQDVKGLLEALGIERAHLAGISMGGLIAQEFALSFPERLRKLILVATTAGGARVVLPDMEVMQFFSQLGVRPPEENLEKGLPFVFTPRFIREHPEEIEELRRWMLEREPVPPEATLAQLAAIAGFNAEARVSEIQHPTLVIGCSDDRVMPVENSKFLVERIPNAKLVVLKGCGHLCPIEKAQEFNEIVLGFLREG